MAPVHRDPFLFLLRLCIIGHFVFKFRTFRFSDYTAPEFEIKTQLSVDEYLQAYGVGCSKKKEPLKDLSQATRLYHAFIGETLDRGVTEQLRKCYRGKTVQDIAQAEALQPVINSKPENKSLKGLSAMLESIGFETARENTLSKNEVDYLTGGWFEELVYFLLKKELPDADISMGVLLAKGNHSTNNDLDVVMCWQDKLSIVECKTSLAIEGKFTQLFNEAVYKAAAINKNFGLTVSSALYTLDDFSTDAAKDYWDKADVFRITLIDRNKLKEKFPELEAVSHAP